MEAEEITVSDLAQDPTKYENQRVSVEGRIMEEIGERSYFLPYFYPHVTTNYKGELTTELKMSLSQVRVVSWKFSNGEATIEVTQRKGGMYLPLPIVVTGKPSLPTDTIQLSGTWKEKSEGGFVLHIEDVEESQTEEGGGTE
jgi:hypothetical protein